MASYMLFWKNLEIENDMIHKKKFKKIYKNTQKNVTLFSSNLNRIFGQEKVEIWFSYFWKKL